MVTKRDLARKDMCIDEYFEYILFNKEQGNTPIARELFNDLSEKQREEFFEYSETLHFYDVDEGELVSEMINFRNYFTQ